MSNRYGHHQKCVLAHISIEVKRSGPKGVGRLHPIHDAAVLLVGVGGPHPSNRNACRRPCLWGAIWAVVQQAAVGYTKGPKRPGSRKAERAPGDPGADPLNLIRVIPAKGAMRKSIPEERALRETIPGCSSRLSLRARVATEGGCA